MRIRLLAPAALFVALRAPTSLAQNVQLPGAIRRASASEVLQRLLIGREALGLNPDQVARSTALSNRFRSERGRSRIVALDRVPEAFRPALVVLTPEQRANAVRALEGSSP